MEQYINLNDISNELLIIPKATIEDLTKLENCADCIALYIFYYKTAKWQKTNKVKANDEYVKKSLKWCSNKIMKIKSILKEKGLINIVQQRKDGKISGWYVEVNYLINTKKQEEIKIKVNDSKNSYFQELEKATTCNEETNALKEYIKCLKKEIEMLKEKNKKESKSSKETKTTKHKYGQYGNVYFTDEQYKKLKEEFPDDYETRIQNVDDYVQTSGKKYKDFLAVIRTWAKKEKTNGYYGKKEFKEMETNESW